MINCILTGAAGHESDTMQRSGDWEHLQASNDGESAEYYLSLGVRKQVFGVSEQVRDKLGCTLFSHRRWQDA